MCRRKTRSAFTLVEILIVIGIIAVLTSMLLPAIGRARGAAKIAACADRLNTLYIMNISFVHEHGGYLPTPATLSETPDPTTGAPSPNAPHMAWGLDGPGVANFQVGTLWPYAGSTPEQRRDAISCPGDEWEQPWNGTKVQNRNFSYSYNMHIRTSASSDTGIKYSLVNPPERKIMIYEEYGPDDAYCTGPTDGNDWMSGRHGGHGALTPNANFPTTLTAYDEYGKSNNLFFDGHVELRPVDLFRTDSSTFYPLQ